ncbi:ParB/RepB/Spo0J family partition protein [Leptolyngbya sp. FACHB-321]|uniref:ParB/RepB/Spo0J family partition protein n=1 Tax=Leptolyngbya sp. FACHB-321 TaxID=2692807 RepID=UPI00168403FD|nr:ParB/RepB/Spo0J family partition protein [Leptolyngbya sp. FACHB-321]MBD2034288.1 ParB/RepB/Spo0J family partition protein [Leptolyngbya sp. FACHB-321]
MASKRPQVPQMRGVTDLFSMEVEGAQPTSTVPINKILLSKHQPRRYFDPEKLAQLTQSVKEHGILEPLLVRPSGSSYELIAGERRYRAAQTVGLTEVPVVVRAFDDRQALQVALIENLQRDDLNPVEETEGLLQLLAIDLDVTTDEVVSVLNQAANAKKRGLDLTDNVIRQVKAIESLLSTVGRFNAESFRVNRLPLLNLPDEVLETLREGKLEFTKARALARVKDEGQRSKLLKQAIAKNLSLNEIRAAVKELTPEAALTVEKMVAQRWSEIGKQLQKTEVWSDRKKRDRITKLLDELEKLTQEG